MDYISILDTYLGLTKTFPDIDLELALLAWNPRGYHRVPDRVFDRLRSKYGILDPNNKVLEFVGDKILGMITMNRILDLYGLTLKPYQYHEIHRSFVSNENLTQIAIDLGICSEIYPGEILVRDGDWHNPCSNSMEAILAALYTQYSVLARISEWFFSISEVRNNFQNHMVKSLGIPSPPSPEDFPELEPSIEILEYREEIPEYREEIPEYHQEIPRIESNLERSPELISTELPIVRMTIVDRSGIIQKDKFCPNIVKTTVLELDTREFPIENDGEEPILKKYSASQAFELFAKRWRSGYTKEKGYFSKGLIPFYTDLYKSPGTGWYGYYLSFTRKSDIIVILSDAVPTKEEFEIAKEHLAYQAVKQCKIYNLDPVPERYIIQEISTEFKDIEFKLRMFIVSVGDDQETVPSLIEYNLGTKMYKIGNIEDVRRILSRWDASILSTPMTNFYEYLKEIVQTPGRKIKLFFGKFNLYSKAINYSLYGFGIRYLDENRIGEIPLSYLTNEQNYQVEEEFLGLQMLDYLDQLGITHTDKTNVSAYVPRDPNKYYSSRRILNYPVGVPFKLTS